MSNELVLMVEGIGDGDAVCCLVRRLLVSFAESPSILDPHPFRVGKVADLCGSRGQGKWVHYVQAAGKRPRARAILLLQDGDDTRFEGAPFCPGVAARTLADRTRAIGGGVTFSIGCVIACREFESWLIAGIESMAGRTLPDGRAGVRSGTVSPASDLEDAPRDAKSWLNRRMDAGYKPTRDQAPLTEMVDLTFIAARRMRSFLRLERTLCQLVGAIQSGRHVVLP